MAGAIYGYQSLIKNENEKWLLDKLQQWDDCDFAFRGVLLYTLGTKYYE